MVSLAVSELGCTELFFVEPDLKVNGAYYRDILLFQQMLPVIVCSPETCLSFNKTAHLPIVHVPPSSICARPHLISFLPTSGHLIAPT